MPIVDADSHVIENEHTWEFFPTSEEQFRPVFVRKGEGGATRQGWLIDGKVRGVAVANATDESLAQKSRATGRDMRASGESRELADVGARLRHMDTLGVDIQVVHPTVFLEEIATRPEVEVPVCRSYNRWMGEVWKQGKERIRWSCVPPLSSMDDALAEIRLSKEQGACAVFMRCIEGEKLLLHKDFYPVYEEASRLDMAIAVHIANSNVAMCDLFSSAHYAGSGFWKFRLATVGAFHALAMSEVPDVFPKLRFGFLEAAAQWIPYVLLDLRRRTETPAGRRTTNMMRDNRFYATCQTDDDVPYLIEQTGEDNLVIGTDYGHSDPSTELDAFQVLKTECGISEAQWRKIVEDNPRALYAL